MSHYTVQFVGTPEEKLAQAKKECVEYLGERRMAALKDVSTANYANKVGIRDVVKQARMVCMVTGIQGRYPYRAVISLLLKGGE